MLATSKDGRGKSLARRCRLHFARSAAFLCYRSWHDFLIEWADDPADRLRCHCGIPRCGLDAGMPEKDLNRARISPTFQQVGGETVPQDMWCDPLGDTRQVGGVMADLANRAGLQVCSGLSSRKQPIDRSLHFPVLTEQSEQASAEDRIAVLGAFTLLNPHQHAAGIHIADSHT